MDEILEPAEFPDAPGPGAEHPFGDHTPADPAVRVEHAGPEPIPERGDDGRLLEHVVGDAVGVDDRRPEFGEPPGHGRLAGTDPSHQSDDRHAPDPPRALIPFRRRPR